MDEICINWATIVNGVDGKSDEKCIIPFEHEPPEIHHWLKISSLVKALPILNKLEFVQVLLSEPTQKIADQVP